MPNSFTAWAWDFGNGVTSTLQNPTHQYTALGVYTVGLTITSGLQADRLVRPSYITVTNPVNTQFTASPLTGYGLLTVTFTDQSVTTYGTLTSWQWSLGDGTTSTQQNLTHLYSHVGAYTVRLTTGTGVYTDTETKLGYVNVVPPKGPRVITYILRQAQDRRMTGCIA